MPIYYTTFMGLRWRLRLVYSRASPLLWPFWREFSKSRQKLAKNLRFLGKIGSKCKILFLGPPKGTSLRETTSFVKIGAGVLAVGWQKNRKTSRVTRGAFSRIWGRKGVIVTWWNFAWGKGPRRNHPCKFRWRSVQGFWGSGCRISHFSIDLRCRP